MPLLRISLAAEIPFQIFEEPFFLFYHFGNPNLSSYLCLQVSTLAHRLLRSRSILHLSFSIKARFALCIVIIPMPPCSFLFVNISQLIKCIFLCSVLLHHRNCLTNLSILLHKPVGTTCIHSRVDCLASFSL